MTEAHPNCRCILVPVELEDVVKKAAKKTTVGPAPAKAKAKLRAYEALISELTGKNEYMASTLHVLGKSIDDRDVKAGRLAAELIDLSGIVTYAHSRGYFDMDALLMRRCSFVVGLRKRNDEGGMAMTHTAGGWQKVPAPAEDVERERKH